MTRLRSIVTAAAGQVVLDALLGTARFEVHGGEHYERFRREHRPVVFALWHGRLLPLSYHHRHQPIAALISRSADGELIARVADHWGIQPVRGSSSRGGTEAVRGLVERARDGFSVAITPDGPRGPRQKLKPGIVAVAQLTGLPILPLAAAADRAWWFEGWDRFLVPKPFARVHVAYGEPHFVPRDCPPEDLARRSAALEAALNRLVDAADAHARA